MANPVQRIPEAETFSALIYVAWLGRKAQFGSELERHCKGRDLRMATFSIKNHRTHGINKPKTYRHLYLHSPAFAQRFKHGQSDEPPAGNSYLRSTIVLSVFFLGDELQEDRSSTAPTSIMVPITSPRSHPPEESQAKETRETSYPPPRETCRSSAAGHVHMAREPHRAVRFCPGCQPFPARVFDPPRRIAGLTWWKKIASRGHQDDVATWDPPGEASEPGKDTERFQLLSVHLQLLVTADTVSPRAQFVGIAYHETQRSTRDKQLQ